MLQTCIYNESNCRFYYEIISTSYRLEYTYSKSLLEKYLVYWHMESPSIVTSLII